MKQPTKRIISMLLSVLMLTSMLPVFTFAANNYTPDDEYYTEIVHDAFIVNEKWAGYTNGQEIEYYFRNEIYGSTSAVENAYNNQTELMEHYETFDENVHFSSIQAALDYAESNNIINPVVILCPGVYNGNITVKQDATIMGTNAGINPNIETDDFTPWTINPEMKNFTSFSGIFSLDKFIEQDVEIIFDGIKFINGFAYIEDGVNQTSSSVVVRNCIFDNMSAPINGQEVLKSIFNFEKATIKSINVTFENVRAEKLSASLIGNYIFKLDIANMYYGDCTVPFTTDIDAFTGVSPEYAIKDSMFYNNVTEFGVLLFDHAQKDSSARSKTTLEISGTKFIDGPANYSNSNNSTAFQITYVITGNKNELNIHDCDFVSAQQHTGTPIDLNFSASAAAASLTDSIRLNNNRFIGYPVLNETAGLLKQSKLDFSANYYANADGSQVDPVYPSSSSLNNINIDYYWIDYEKTIPSSIFYIDSIGTDDIEVRNNRKTIHLSLDQDEKFDVNIKAKDAETKYELYADTTFTQKVTKLDSAELYTGFEKNTYYAVGTSDKIPGYKFVYTVYISTYNPKYASEFNIPNTYMYSPEVKGLATGTEICKDWEGTSYKFVVGKTIFADPEQIFEIADIPTIIIPAGTYQDNFRITESAVILGAKAGINPNIQDFENFENGWLPNEERLNADQETTFENCAIYIATTTINASVVIDGITLSEGSGFYDMGEGNETYTTTTLRNINVNNAGGSSFIEKNDKGADVARAASTIFTFGGSNSAANFEKNHKDVRLINIRYENQSTYTLISACIESIYIDGLYFANCSKRPFSAEVTAPKTQNFKLEVKNSFFYNCSVSSGGGIICVDNKTTDSPDREYNKVIYDHNLFYEPATYLYGVVGIRFYSKRDSFYFTNNTVISTYAQHSLMPGNSGWFTGLTACENLTTEQLETAETVTDVVIKYNRICGPYKPVDKQNVKYDTCWDYSYNYVCDLDKPDVLGGNFEGGIFDRTTPGIKMQKYSETQKNYMKCTTYYADWDMTELVDAPDSYKTELNYNITSLGEITEVDSSNFNYTDSVSAETNEYTFGVELLTKQASYGIYTDVDCTNKVSDTVTLDKNVNVFYIRIASYKNTVVHTYKATITKPLSNEANIISLDNHSISGNNITAIVPVGTTSLLLNNIKLSSGATYKMFNDAEKTKPFLVTKITNISEKPTYKYIEVTSEDKSTTKDYVLCVKQGVNSLADITAVANAVKTDDTTFEAYISVSENSFEFSPTASAGATVSIFNEGREQIVNPAIPCMIYNIGDQKNVEIKVTSENGNTKTFTLKILKDKSNADVEYIFNMYNTNAKGTEFYTKVNTAEFKLLPKFKTSGTTYSVYTDSACTKAYDFDVLYLTKSSNVYYMKATSTDKTNSKVYKLVVDTNNPESNPNIPDEPIPDDPNDITKIFTDVEKGSWYEEFVKYAYQNGLFNGTSENTFTPNGNMTRAQFVKVIANFVKVDVNNNVDSRFDDVASNQWYTGAIEWAAENGIVSGVDENSFAPDKEITREQMCAIIVRTAENYLNLSLPSTEAPITFSDDAQISSWAKDAVYKCQKAGIISGNNGAFNPQDSTTRAQGATVFTQCHKLMASV